MYTLHDLDNKGRRVGGRGYYSSQTAGFAARAIDQAGYEKHGNDHLVRLELRKSGVPVNMTGGGVEMYYFVKAREQ